MQDVTQFFIHSAMAQTTTTPGAPSGGSITSTIMNFMPMILIFMVFYLLIIRPQQRKMEEQEKMNKALRRGDRVVTSGGIHGKIARLEGDDTVVLEIADGIQIKVARAHIVTLAAKTDPAAPTNDGDDADKKS